MDARQHHRDAQRPLGCLDGLQHRHRQDDPVRRVRRPAGLLADTWAYDPATNRWIRLATGHGGPPRRDFSSMAYDTAADTVVLFGGQTGSNGNISATDFNDTWTFRF